MSIPFLSVKPRAIKLKVSPRFPAQVIGRAGIDVTKQNGDYYFDLDYNDFPTISTVPAGATYALIFDPATEQYAQMPIALLGGGISDAPTDGQLYGRKSAAWSVVPAGGGGITDAPNDGLTYGRKSAAWSKVLDAANNLSDLASKSIATRNLAPTDLNLSGTPNGTSPRITSYADSALICAGREYLGAYLNAWRTGGGKVANVLMRGDSTMMGAGLTDPNNTAPDKVFKAVAQRKGLICSNVINLGVSGATTADWKNTHLPADLAGYTGGNIPKLYVLNYGMNDPYTSGAALSIATSISNLRSGFATLRATWSGNQTSVVYVMPNTAYDDAGARNETWREQFAQLARQACRDYGVMFVDVYAALREARYNLLTGWINATDKVHPGDDFEVAIWSVVADAVFQSDFVQVACRKLDVTPASGWTQPASTENMGTVVSGDAVLASGYIQKTTPSTLPANTIVGTVHSYHVPTAHTQGTELVAWDNGSGNWQYLHGFINSNTGDITAKEAVTLTCARLYFGPSIWNH
ncbi:hypothetical protein JQ582_26005 [Bradyrhizobium japonicum]|uniref:SGNH/GDSL hydrolase family protein n=1 Tax=Bradyrhizobium japonicum TaxID=375 RepID=UPI001BA53324|nr:SGNH/GDSL hydrolase family protein [Bradyrhizobium japonicum]MBR0747394.1 hypothetical protein [Bradyrhizobium japonicum]